MRRKRKELRKSMSEEENKDIQMIYRRRRGMIQQHIIKAKKIEAGERVKTIAKEIMNKGIFNRTAYWDFMKGIPKKRIVKGTAVNDKDGKRIDDPTKIKERYEEYFKELLAVKKATNEDERRIEDTVERCFEAMRRKAAEIPIDPVTDEEYEEMKNSLKKDKSQDKEGWMYEIILNAGKDLEESIKTMINEVLQTKKGSKRMEYHGDIASRQNIRIR